MKSLDIFVGSYLENLAESLNFRAQPHTKERAIAVVRRRKRTERASSKERYIEAEQDSAERRRKGEVMEHGGKVRIGSRI
jgi:hypothetical protein